MPYFLSSLCFQWDNQTGILKGETVILGGAADWVHISLLVFHFGADLELSALENICED